MSLTRLKKSIIAKGMDEEHQGLIDLSDYTYRGDRFGRMAPKQVAKERRVCAAIKELVVEGRIVPHTTLRDCWLILVGEN